MKAKHGPASTTGRPTPLSELSALAEWLGLVCCFLTAGGHSGKLGDRDPARPWVVSNSSREVRLRDSAEGPSGTEDAAEAAVRRTVESG